MKLTPMSLAQPRPLIAQLRQAMRAAPPARLSLGASEIDACVAGGLPLGRLHEVLAAGIEMELGTIGAAFIASLLARLPDPGTVLWAANCCDLHPPGLLAYGLDPGRLLMVQTTDDSETLQTLETALRAGGVAAVVGEAERLPRLAGRRLHLACLAHGITSFVLRRRPRGQRVGRAEPREGTAAATRWRLSPAPSAPAGEAPPRWHLELLHARDGREGDWIVEVDDATHALRVVAGPGHASGTTERLAAG